jgi:hypothetical protein
MAGKTKMNYGGAVKPMMAKGGMAKKPAAGVAIMIAMPAKAKGKGKTKMAMGGCATKKK